MRWRIDNEVHVIFRNPVQVHCGHVESWIRSVVRYRWRTIKSPTGMQRSQRGSSVHLHSNGSWRLPDLREIRRWYSRTWKSVQGARHRYMKCRDSLLFLSCSLLLVYFLLSCLVFSSLSHSFDGLYWSLSIIWSEQSDLIIKRVRVKKTDFKKDRTHRIQFSNAAIVIIKYYFPLWEKVLTVVPFRGNTVSRKQKMFFFNKLSRCFCLFCLLTIIYFFLSFFIDSFRINLSSP